MEFTNLLEQKPDTNKTAEIVGVFIGDAIYDQETKKWKMDDFEASKMKVIMWQYKNEEGNK